jgi:hypothetical protein
LPPIESKDNATDTHTNALDTWWMRHVKRYCRRASYSSAGGGGTAWIEVVNLRFVREHL